MVMRIENNISKRSRTLLCALTVGAFAVGLNTFVIIGALNEISNNLSIKPQTAGWLISIYAIIYAICAPTSALFLRNVSARKLLISSIILFVLGNLICSLSNSLTELTTGRVIAALGASLYIPAATNLAAKLVPDHRKGFALSLVFGGLTASQAIGIPITTFIALSYGWRYAFTCVVVFGIVAIIPLAFVHWRDSEVSTRARDCHSPGDSRGTFGIFCVTFLVVSSEYVVFSYVSVLFHSIIYRDVPLLPIILFLFGAGAVAGNLATGWLTDKTGPRFVTRFSVGLQSLAIVILVLFREYGLVAATSVFLWGAASYMYLVPIQYSLLQFSPGSARVVLAINSALIYCGIAAGTTLGGKLLTDYGEESLAILAGFLGMLGYILATVYMPLPRRRKSRLLSSDSCK